MTISSPYSTDTEPESILSNADQPYLPLQTLLSSSPPTNLLLLRTRSESEDHRTPTVSNQSIPKPQSPSNSITPVPSQVPLEAQTQLELDSDDELDQTSQQVQHSTHYKEFGDMENEEIIQDGYLEKKGERRKTWKRRWFVLRKTSLVYYKNDKEYRLLRMIPLTDIHTCAEVQVKHHDNTFGIVTSERTYYVRAKTKAERDTWISKVNQAKDSLKKAIRQHSGDDILINKSNSPHHNTPIIRSATVIGDGFDSIRLDEFGLKKSDALNVEPRDIATLVSNTTLTRSSNLNASHINRPTPSIVYSPDPSSTASDCISSASDTANRRRHIRSTTLLSDIMADPLAKPYQRRDLSSGSSSNDPTGHDLTYLSSAVENLLSSSDDEDEDDVAVTPEASQFNSSPQPSGMVDNYPLSIPAGERKLTLPEASKTIIQGYLMKQGKRKTWRKRYFTLTSEKLVYSRTHMMKVGNRGTKQISVRRILDAIECDKTTSLTSDSSTGGGTVSKIEARCFKIITSDRTYLLNAPTEEDEIKWISAIKCLLSTFRDTKRSDQ
ncbi:uncharacterized protein MELLADRAFT_116896 [Melampsora larici-populina 98AG31]|uniref:PH domain-containing protein n=1 Tax=Melampsora larici-populina (strain 98AG31 / pathotype 3-4-7) TaxID=747676 RepID=F4RR22_MELLP|nr:uncharacterized protein MELLADRAFT_116896 [Melampsora larici-populina 98AG31]EGG05133.1 hypothetical protein MELLADRAFT_116896 [Melampsora larici-populina 98AG31]